METFTWMSHGYLKLIMLKTKLVTKGTQTSIITGIIQDIVQDVGTTEMSTDR